jgi:hypothetical protein
VLQGVEADEHTIGGQQQVLMPAITRALPGELHRLDEHQTTRCAAADFVVRDRIRRKTATSATVPAWSVMVAGESSSAGAVVTNAKYKRVCRPIVTDTLGVIDR